MRLRFTLRSLLLGITALALVLALVVVPVLRGARQRRVLEGIRLQVQDSLWFGYDYQEMEVTNYFGYREYGVSSETSFLDGLGRDAWSQVTLVRTMGHPRDTDRFFELLSELPRLKSLTVSAPAQAEHWQRLTCTESLVELHWTGPAEKESLAALRRFPKLKRLVLLPWNINSRLDDLTVLAELPELDTFVADSRCLTAAEIHAVAQVRTLKSLVLTRNGIDDAMAQELAGLAELEFLDLSDNRLTSVGVHELRRLENLRHLKLNDVLFEEDGLASLAELPKLERLEIRDAKIRGDAFLRQGGFPSLKQLTCSGNDLTPEGWRGLANLPQLQELFVVANGQPRFGENGDVGFSNLQRLRLNGCTLSGDFWKGVAALPALNDLCVDSAQVVDGAEIRGSPTLESFTSFSTTFNQQQVLDLLQGSPRLKTLRMYNLTLTQAEIDDIRARNQGRSIEFP